MDLSTPIRVSFYWSTCTVGSSALVLQNVKKWTRLDRHRDLHPNREGRKSVSLLVPAAQSPQALGGTYPVPGWRATWEKGSFSCISLQQQEVCPGVPPFLLVIDYFFSCLQMPSSIFRARMCWSWPGSVSVKAQGSWSAFQHRLLQQRDLYETLNWKQWRYSYSPFRIPLKSKD